MQKSHILIAVAALGFAFAPVYAQSPESAQQAKVDARKATDEAEAANRKAATAIDVAIKTSTKEDAHTAAQHIRAAVADARDSARVAAEKTEAAYQKAVEANREFAMKTRESAKNAADATSEAVDKAEAWFKAATESDKAAIEKAGAEVHASLLRAETATKDAVASGKAAWKKDIDKSTAKK